MRLEECETDDAALGEEQTNKGRRGARRRAQHARSDRGEGFPLDDPSRFRYLQIQAIGCDLTGGAEGSAIRRAGSG